MHARTFCTSHRNTLSPSIQLQCYSSVVWNPLPLIKIISHNSMSHAQPANCLSKRLLWWFISALPLLLWNSGVWQVHGHRNAFFWEKLVFVDSEISVFYNRAKFVQALGVCAQLLLHFPSSSQVSHLVGISTPWLMQWFFVTGKKKACYLLLLQN